VHRDVAGRDAEADQHGMSALAEVAVVGGDEEQLSHACSKSAGAVKSP
jgi:hypothetical protein